MCPIPYQDTHKAHMETKRRDGINAKLNELKEIVRTSKDNMSQEHVLFAATYQLTGIQLEEPQVGPIRGSRNEKKTEREKHRREKQVRAYDALKKYIMEHKLGTQEQRDKLEKTIVLDIVIEHLTQKKSESPSLISHPPLPTPSPKGPLPMVQPVAQESMLVPINPLWLLAYYNMMFARGLGLPVAAATPNNPESIGLPMSASAALPNSPGQTPLPEPETEESVPEDDEEIIDVEF